MAIVYVTTNSINGKKYLGKHHSNVRWYLGSGVALKLAIKKYGKENFTKTIIQETPTLESAAQIERELSFLWNVVDDTSWYNMKPGGNGGSSKGRIVTEKTKQLISKNRKGKSTQKGEMNHMYGKKHTQEWCDNHSQKLQGYDYGNQGENHSSAKEVIFTSPQNIEYIVKGIRKFCRDNRLNFNIMIGRLRKNKPDLTTEKHPWKVKYA